MKRYWDDVEIGHKLEPIHKDAISRVKIAHMAAASDDFSAIHLDDEFAKSAGYGSVFAPGTLALAIVEETLRSFAQNLTIAALSTTFQRLIWPNDLLSVKGLIIRRYRKHDEHRIQFSLWIENQNGDVMLKGQAICLLFKNAAEEAREKRAHPAFSQASYEELTARCEAAINPGKETAAKTREKEFA